MTEREDFNAWASKYDLRPFGDSYANETVSHMWKSWQARAAIAVQPSAASQPSTQPSAGEVAKDAGWQPIETAPRDGSEICTFNGEQGRMWWSGGEAGGESWGLWIWSDGFLSDVDPSPEQPSHWRLPFANPIISN